MQTQINAIPAVFNEYIPCAEQLPICIGSTEDFYIMTIPSSWNTAKGSITGEVAFINKGSEFSAEHLYRIKLHNVLAGYFLIDSEHVASGNQYRQVVGGVCEVSEELQEVVAYVATLQKQSNHKTLN